MVSSKKPSKMENVIGAYQKIIVENVPISESRPIIKKAHDLLYSHGVLVGFKNAKLSSILARASRFGKMPKTSYDTLKKQVTEFTLIQSSPKKAINNLHKSIRTMVENRINIKKMNIGLLSMPHYTGEPSEAKIIEASATDVNFHSILWFFKNNGYLTSKQIKFINYLHMKIQAIYIGFINNPVFDSLPITMRPVISKDELLMTLLISYHFLNDSVIVLDLKSFINIPNEIDSSIKKDAIKGYEEILEEPGNPSITHSSIKPIVKIEDKTEKEKEVEKEEEKEKISIPKIGFMSLEEIRNTMFQMKIVEK